MKYYLITNKATFMYEKKVRQYPYQLFLAPLLVADPGYKQIVAEAIAAGVQAILDNGAHEGQLISTQEYYNLIIELHPWCVVLPDLIGQRAFISRTTSLAFLDRIYRLQELPHVMYVPQGDHEDQVVNEFIWANQHFRVGPTEALLGFGDSYKVGQKAKETAEEARLRLFYRIIQHLGSTTAHPPYFHILGTRTKGTLVFSTYNCVISTDSVDPCRNAWEQMRKLRDPLFIPSEEDKFRLDSSSREDAVPATLLQQTMQQLNDEYGADILSLL